MYATELLRLLRKVKRNGKGCTACCPAHDDEHQSLSVTEKGGKILLHCFAGCSVEEICAALKIEVSELFQDHNSHSTIEAVYDYRDEKGELLYQAIRYFPKAFSQWRPDGNGGFIQNLNGTRRVLYRLPELPNATSVLVCEGEKDVETARRLGFVATCNSGGAGKWRDEYNGALCGKYVDVIADADEAGRKHAQQVAESLSGIATRIKVVELPGAKDLSEWAGRGGKGDALRELILKAPEWRFSSKDAHGAGGFVLTPLGELLDRPVVPVDYLLDGILVSGTVSEVIAKPKVGKGTFARNLSLAVARGDDFLGLKTKQGEVIYLALEEREEDVTNDFRAMGADGTEPIYVHSAAAPAEGIARLCELIRQRRPALAVVDPLFRLARVKDEKGYAEIYHALGPLIDIARETGTHVLLLHHAGKAPKADPIDSPLGSISIAGIASTVIVIKRTESRRTIQTVQRIGQDLAESVLEFDPESRTLSLGAEKSQADVNAAAQAILEYLKSVAEPKTEPEIDDLVEGNTGPKRKALRRLVEEEKVSREGAGRKGDPFKYRFLFSCFTYTSKTSKQECGKPPQTPINTGDILVFGTADTKADALADIPFGRNGNSGRNPETTATCEVDAQRDYLFDAAVCHCRETGYAAVGDLMSTFGLTRVQCIRYLDEMERRGLVGPANGSGPRPFSPPGGRTQ